MSDLVRREEAIEWVKNILATHLYYHPRSKSRNVPIDEVIDRLERVPSIDAVPVRHGRWEMEEDPYGFFDEIPVCSECGCTTKLRETYRFCPSCGARMDERKES